MHRLPLCALGLLALAALTTAQGPRPADWPQFRGPKRDNISPDKGLLTKWPAKGPRLVWTAEGVGQGYSSVAIKGERVFTMGAVGNKAFVYAVSRKTGKKLWGTEIGTSGGGGGYPGTRCTPAVDGNLVFGISPQGQLAALSADKGKVVWRKDFRKDFGGSAGGWEYSESPLVDGDRLICTPGGAKATLVCLNKKTGEEIWRSPIDSAAGYSSVVISNAGGTKQYVTLVSNGVVGVDAKDGKKLWMDDKFSGNTANIPAVVPLGDQVFASAGYGKPAMLLSISSSGGDYSAEVKYEKRGMGNRLGGVIVVGDLLFSDQDMGGNLYCLEWKTGEVKWQRNKAKNRGKGSGSAALAYADGHLYVRYDDGTVALVPASGDGYEEKGSFRIPGSPSQSWSHPVVIGGRLYLKEQNRLYCYDVKGK